MGEEPMECADKDCRRDARAFTLYRVNPVGEPGVFMCRTHWHLEQARKRAPIDVGRLRAAR